MSNSFANSAAPLSPAPTQARSPLLFMGHGSPMNALDHSIWSQGYRQIAEALPRPQEILVVSAHWVTPETQVLSGTQLETIHDFSGFPDELYQLHYPAPGAPELAHQVQKLLGLPEAALNSKRGLDHGSWAVLRQMYPDAQVKVSQLSLGSRLTPEQHYKLGRGLRPLRERGTLIIGSGNLTHNLRDAFSRMHSGQSHTPDWASGFVNRVCQLATEGAHDELVHLLAKDPRAPMAHPSLEHWLPLLYVLAASDPEDQLSIPIAGFDLGSLSMHSLQWSPR